MKSVLITGGSRGIGAECVKAFSDKGYKVCFFYKENDERAEYIAKTTNARAFKCDVSSYKDVERAKNELNTEFDIIVNNAGISQIKMFQDITEDDWDDMFDVNIKSMYNVIKMFLSPMINKKWGRIINISSMWGEEGGSCEVHYSASKSAIIGFTKALAKELGPSGITVNCVSPGVIDTQMNEHLSCEDIKELSDMTPVGRIGKAEEVAKAVVYLAEDTGFITGAVLPVNGGILM